MDLVKGLSIFAVFTIINLVALGPITSSVIDSAIAGSPSASMSSLLHLLKVVMSIPSTEIMAAIGLMGLPILSLSRD